jgi:transposase-like protein
MSRKFYRYSFCFKQSVVSSIEDGGLSIEQARSKYGIGGSTTIQKWLVQFGKNHLLNKVVMVQTISERDELKRLKAELSALKVQYAELAIDHKLSVRSLEVADEMFNLDLKKKYERELSKLARKR